MTLGVPILKHFRVIMCMSTPLFSVIFTKRKTICDFLFASHNHKALHKWSLIFFIEVLNSIMREARLLP